MKKILFLIVVIFGATLGFCLPFNSKISGEELEKLNNGEVVIRSINKYKNVSIQGENQGIKKIKEVISNLNPNYLAEIIQVRPYKGNEDLAEKMRAVLEDISNYAGIQYWSVQHERYWDLYSSAQILGKKQIDENTVIYNSDLYMEPFGIIHTPITIEMTDDYLFYVSTNNNTLTFKGVSCVKKQNMKSGILLFRDGDNWILYGLGGCKAPKIAMFEERIERSFINRIKTFCNYVFTKI